MIAPIGRCRNGFCGGGGGAAQISAQPKCIQCLGGIEQVCH